MIPDKSIGFFKKNTNIKGFLQDHIQALVESGISEKEIVFFSDISFESLAHLTLTGSLKEWNLLNEEEFFSEIQKIYHNQETSYEPPVNNFAYHIKLSKIIGKTPKLFEPQNLLNTIFQEYQETLKKSKNQDIFDELNVGLKNIKQITCFIIFIPKNSWIECYPITIDDYINAIISSFSHTKKLLIITDFDIQESEFSIEKINLDIVESAVEKNFIQIKDNRKDSELISSKKNNLPCENDLFLIDSYLNKFLQGSLSDFHILYLPEFINKSEFKLLILYGLFAIENLENPLKNSEVSKMFIKSFQLSEEGSACLFQMMENKTLDFVFEKLTKKNWSSDDFKILSNLKKQHHDIRTWIKKFEKLNSCGVMMSNCFFKRVIKAYELEKNFDSQIIIDRYLSWLYIEISKWFNFSSERWMMFKKSLELIWHMTQQEDDIKNKLYICDLQSFNWYYESFTNIFYYWTLHHQIQNFKNNNL